MKKTTSLLALALALSMSSAQATEPGRGGALEEVTELLSQVAPLWVRAEELGRQCQFEFRRYGLEARETCVEFEEAYFDAGMTGERIGQLSSSLSHEEIMSLDMGPAVHAQGVAERTRAIYQHVMAEMRSAAPQ